MTKRLPAEFGTNAAYALHAIDFAGRRAQVLHFDVDDYRRASFLDERALGHRPVSGWVASLEELCAASAPNPLVTPRYLFHLGHVGSTLLSRLLDCIPDVLGLREPLPLLALAHERAHPDFEQWLAVVRALLGRPFDDRRSVIVKPTSVVTSIDPELIESGEVRACLLHIDLETWMATMFRSPDLVNAVLQTEHVRGIDEHESPPADGYGERMARIWVHEQLRWHALRAAMPERLTALSFDTVIRDPYGALRGLGAHYQLPVPQDLESRIDASGLLGRDAKRPGHVFNQDARDMLLSQSRARHFHVIEAGLRWAEDALRQAPTHEALIRLNLRPS